MFARQARGYIAHPSRCGRLRAGPRRRRLGMRRGRNPRRVPSPRLPGRTLPVTTRAVPRDDAHSRSAAHAGAAASFTGRSPPRTAAGEGATLATAGGVVPNSVANEPPSASAPATGTSSRSAPKCGMGADDPPSGSGCKCRAPDAASTQAEGRPGALRVETRSTMPRVTGPCRRWWRPVLRPSAYPAKDDGMPTGGTLRNCSAGAARL
jgi:hypothetical protein